MLLSLLDLEIGKIALGAKKQMCMYNIKKFSICFKGPSMQVVGPRRVDGRVFSCTLDAMQHHGLGWGGVGWG